MPKTTGVALTNALILLALCAVPAVAAETRTPGADEFMEQVRRYESGRFREGSRPRQVVSPEAKAVEKFQRALSLHARKGATPGELKEAAALYQAASDAGLPQASTNLALLYLEGKGVKKDTKKALSLLNTASKRNVPEADLILARLYLTGKDLKRDDKKGEWHLNRAAKSGNPDAVRMLADYREWKEKNELAMKQYQEILKKARAEAGGRPTPLAPAVRSSGLFPAIPGESYLGLNRAAAPFPRLPPSRPAPVDKSGAKETAAVPRPAEGHATEADQARPAGEAPPVPGGEKK